MRKEIKILVLTEFFIALSLGLIGPFYIIFIENILRDNLNIGYSYAVFWITVGILSPIFGKMSDIYNKKIFLILGGILAFFVAISYSFITTIYQLIILEVINGIATSLFNPVYRSVVANLTSRKNRGMEYGIIDSISNVTYGLSALLAAVIISVFGIKILFLFSGIFQLFSSFFIASKTKKI